MAVRTLPLFVFLLLARDRPTARDHLAYKFWPESSEDEARANLRRHLHRLNGALFEASGERWFETGDRVVAFNSHLPLDLDVARLEAASLDPSGAADAVALYAGDLYESCDEEWLVPHRERLRSTYLQLLFGLIDRYRGERRFPEAIALSQKALHVDPFREDALRTLMSLRYESGDRSNALAEFAAFRDRLATEIGVDPMPETQSLYDAIKRHAAVGAGQSDRPASGRAMPFDGRDGEIESLRHAWQQAAKGHARVALVSGEAGIGKTRLLREFATLAEREGGRVFWGASSAPEARPYEPVTEALGGAIGEIARMPLSNALLNALALRFPELRSAVRPEANGSVDVTDRRERERFFEAIALAMERLCAARPTILVLEDVHWVFADTFELIARIVQSCARSPLFAIVSFREEETTAALRTFKLDVSMKYALRLGLGRLDPAACGRMLDAGFEKLPEGARAWAIELAKGNPLFLSELVREYESTAADARAGAALPTSLESAILGRLANLSGPARSLIDIAAVGGTIVSIDVLQHASGWPLAEVLDATDELVDRFVLRETATGSRGDYQFAHDLVREAVISAMPMPLQMRRHRRFANVLSKFYPDRQDEFARTLAHHFEMGGRPNEAASFYARAATVAHAQFAWHDAIALAEHGLRLERRLPERFSLHAVRVAAASKSGDRDRWNESVTAMLDLAERADDDALRAIALNRSSDLSFESGDFERQRECTEGLERLAVETGNTRLLRDSLRDRARAEVGLGRPASAAATMRSIDAIEGLERSRAEHFEDLRVLAHALTAAAGFDEARRAIAEAELRAGPDLTLAEQIAIVRARASLAIEENDRVEAARQSRTLLDLCAKLGDVEGEANAHQTAARVDWWTFDIASARQHLRAAASIFERIGKLQSCMAIAINSGVLENHVGLLDEAERYYSEAFSYAKRLGEDPGRLSLCYGNLAYVALMRGDGERALADSQRALELARSASNARLIAINLGQSASALRLLGRDDARSLAYFSEAFELCATFNFGEDRLELAADAIPTFLRSGMLEAALAFAEEVERAIAADASAVVMPVAALANAADAFEATGNSGAAKVARARARALLHERLENLPDERTRAAYAALRFHRPLLAPHVGRFLDGDA